MRRRMGCRCYSLGGGGLDSNRPRLDTGVCVGVGVAVGVDVAGGVGIAAVLMRGWSFIIQNLVGVVPNKGGTIRKVSNCI